MTPVSETEAFEAGNFTSVTGAGPDSTSSRARRSCVGRPTYNLAQLSGNAGRRKRPSTGDHGTDPKRRNVSDASLLSVNDPPEPSTQTTQPAAESAANPVTSSIASSRQRRQPTRDTEAAENRTRDSGAAAVAPRTTRASARLRGEVAASGIVTKAAILGKRGRRALGQGLSSLSRELRRLQDTNEFAHVDTEPVIHTVWANGKLVTLDDVDKGPATKKAKTDLSSSSLSNESESRGNGTRKKDEESRKGEDGLEVHMRKGRRTKHWLDKGLYAGQETPRDPSQGLTPAEKKKMAQIPELKPSGRINKALPLPIFNGMRLLIQGRDFKLPFDVCNPLPPGQPKPEHWTRISKSKWKEKEAPKQPTTVRRPHSSRVSLRGLTKTIFTLTS